LVSSGGGATAGPGGSLTNPAAHSVADGRLLWARWPRWVAREHGDRQVR